VGKARKYGEELKRFSAAKLAKIGTGPAGHDSDARDLFAERSFRGHFEDAQVRSGLLGGLIKTRNSAGFTQAQVAQVMETTQSAVSELEGGATDPRLSTLQRYARAVGAHLQVRLNLFSSIAQEPSQWPALAPNVVMFHISDSGVHHSEDYLRIISSGGALTSKREIPEPVAG
jgi:transcriptional regulator with XRE-family HTH domain